MPRAEHGSLVLRDILTKGDNFDPREKGAVLHYANFFAYGRLAPGAWTTPSRLEGQQEIYYILGGEGEITAGGVTAELHQDIAVLMPVGLEFVMRCTGDQPLTMYVINEPLPDDNGIVGNIGRVPFHPNTKMVVKDDATAHVRTPAGRRSVYRRRCLWTLGTHRQRAIFLGGWARDNRECDYSNHQPGDDGRAASPHARPGGGLGFHRRDEPCVLRDGAADPTPGQGLYAAPR